MIDKNQAEIFRLGLTSGVISLNELIEWADKRIEDGSEDYVIIEISLATDINNLVLYLRSIQGNADPQIVVYGYFSILYNILSKQPEKARYISSTLYNIMRNYEIYLTPEEIGTIYELDDAYDLAVTGYYGSIETFKRDLKVFLSKYQNEYQSIFL